MTSQNQENTNPQDKQTLDSFVVKGRLIRPDGSPVIGCHVRAFDQDLRHEQALGEDTQTAKDGSYEINYTRTQFSRAEKNSADLIVRVYDMKGEKLLVASQTIFNAQPVETIDNLIVSNGDYTGPSEYEQLLEELEPLLVNVKGTRKSTIFHKLADLKEDEHQQEITFLSRETGRDRQIISFLVRAAQLSNKTKLMPNVFYGLFRRGISLHLPNLLAQKPVVLRRALKAAVQRNLIPEFENEKELEQILGRFKDLRIQNTLEEPEQSGKAALGDLLETALPQNRSKKEAFLKRYLERQDQEQPEPIEDFWKALRNTEEFKDDIDNLQFTLQAGTLTQNHLPLVKELHQLRREGKLQSPRDWAKLDADAWIKLIQKQPVDGQPIGIPPDVPGKDDTEKTKNYANMMARFIEDAFPTPVIAHHMEQKSRPEQADLIRFFGNNQGFEFRKISVDTYLEQNSQSAPLAGLKNPDAATKTLKGMQRLFKVTPRYPEISILLDNGLSSAHDITILGKNTFVKQYSDLLGGANRALELFNGAFQTEAMSITLFSNHSKYLDGTDVAAIGPAQTHPDIEGSEELQELGIAIPTWKRLFGSLELCDCEHCRSVYSPASYLVDILAFLKKRPANTADQIALNILYERRPDLGNLDLSCENTNTPLPYVDLVNEVLENAIAPLPDFRPFEINADRKQDLDNRYLSPELQSAFGPSLSAGATIVVLNPGREWRILDTSYAYSVLDEEPADDTLQVVARGWQTYTRSEELRANPQYTNPVAYDRLAEAVYPWQLPFDRWITEARAYLEHLGVHRHDLMAQFQSQGTSLNSDENAIACEYLGLTPVEWQILTGTYPREIWEYWGYPSVPTPSDWVEELSQVSTFLQTSGMNYQELLELLSTQFVNPERLIHIVSTDTEDLSTCDITKLMILNLDQYTLDHTHRFVRLWRKLDWSMIELDKVIDTLKPTERTIVGLNHEEWADLLRRVSFVKRLSVDLKVPVIKMLSWWALIDTTENVQPGKPSTPSLYDDLFQNNAVFSSPDDAQIFRLNEDRDQLLETNGKISETIPAICAALEISAADLSLLTAGLSKLVEDETTADDLNLGNLSYLFRLVSLSKALKLSIQEYLTVRDLTELKPLLDPIRITPDDDRVYPEDTLEFIETLDKIRASGFNIVEIAYLLRYKEEKVPGITPSEDTIAMLLSEIRAGLQAIADEQIIAPDLNGELTRQKLLMLNWDPALVEEVIAVLNNSNIFSVSLTAAPLPIELPLSLEDIPDDLPSADEKIALRRKVSLNTLTEPYILQFEGVMSENEQTALLGM